MVKGQDHRVMRCAAGVGMHIDMTAWNSSYVQPILLRFLTLPLGELQSSVMSMSVCLSARISQKPT